jgi:hypothetical protein
MADAPFFHDASGTVRFSVTVEGQDVNASIGREVLRYHYRTAENADTLSLSTRRAWLRQAQPERLLWIDRQCV